MLRLVGRIYDGALDARAWPAILAELAAFVSAPRALILTPLHPVERGGLVIPHAIEQSFLEQWSTRYHAHDIWTQTIVQRDLFQEGSTILSDDLVSREELLASMWYREFLSQMDIADVLTNIVFGLESKDSLTTAISFYRGVRDKRYGESERSIMQCLLPHLSRALGVMYRLRDAELKSAATLAALDRLSCGVVLLDSLGRVTHLNRTMKRLLEQSDGLRLRALRPGDPHGRLVADTDPERLDQAIEECLRTDALRVPMFSAGVSIPRASGGRDYLVQMSPLPGSNDFAVDSRAARVILFVSDPDAPAELDGALLKRLYGLTPVEIRLVGFLYGGKTLADAAELACTSQAAARSQLRRVFDKTGTSRQAGLTRLLAGLHSTRSD